MLRYLTSYCVCTLNLTPKFIVTLVLATSLMSIVPSFSQAVKTLRADEMLLQIGPNDRTSASLRCMSSDRKVSFQSAQTWSDNKPSAPSFLILMPSEETFAAKSALIDHGNKKYSFVFDFSFDDEFLQSIKDAELLVLSGINGFEGEGIILQPSLVKQFLSKCVIRK